MQTVTGGTVHLKTCGIGSARAHFSEILARAHQGSSTVITHHGKPYAIVAPVDPNPPRTSILASLRGSGTGLWGEHAAASVAQMRDEWT